MRFRDLPAEFIRAAVGMDPQRVWILPGTECLRLAQRQKEAIRFLLAGAPTVAGARLNTWTIIEPSRYVRLRFHWTYSY